MIFTGDVSIANGDLFHFVDFPENLLDKAWIFNFEGGINKIDKIENGVISNSVCVFDSLKKFKIGPIFLANNHINDRDDILPNTIEELTSRGYLYFGAGKDFFEAAKTCKFIENSKTYALLGFGWGPIGCKHATSTTNGVNPFTRTHVIASVRQALKENIDKCVVVIHGNYEFEKYPQPGHRELAMELIDYGVHSVIFHHSHLLCTLETYKGKTISYGLGNWAFSYGKFFSSDFKFPLETFEQGALELCEHGDLIHRAQFIPPNTVRYIDSTQVDKLPIHLKAEFEGMSHDEYKTWFKSNRIKKLFLPIYYNKSESFYSYACDYWVQLRQRLIRLLVLLGVKRNVGSVILD